MDGPEDIVGEAVTKHVHMINEFKGVPGVKPERLTEGMKVSDPCPTFMSIRHRLTDMLPPPPGARTRVPFLPKDEAARHGWFLSNYFPACLLQPQKQRWRPHERHSCHELHDGAWLLKADVRPLAAVAGAALRAVSGGRAHNVSGD
jgi:hypothetical protein